MMTSAEIRQSFLDFFKSKGHTIVPSAPVIPHGDKTLLFTNAGMNQFKDVFLGEGTRSYTRAADTQKCLRVSGKHNDLEEVGHDTYHHTLFEMLGNWSFGDYYKKEAIEWAWELLTKVWKLDKSRLYATVYESDDEAAEIWAKVTDIDPTHIIKCGAKDNFWEMGETGPCGPCSEIHYDSTPDKSGGQFVNAGVPEVIEVWNLVFIQNNRRADGSLEELPQKHVDTGMGFERIAAVMQGKKSNYDSDVFAPYIKWQSEKSGIAYGAADESDIAMRVISDHVRALSCAIADGAFPGNEGRGYVLRRILRRAAAYSRKLGFKEPFLCDLSNVVGQTMGGVFPELRERRDLIYKVLRGEEESFNATLDRGLALFDEISKRESESESPYISGEEAFKLHDTFGFPIDLTQVLAHERGLAVDMKRFEELMTEQRDRSRKDRYEEKGKISELKVTVVEHILTSFSPTFVKGIKNISQTDVEHIAENTEFTGYDKLDDISKMLAVIETNIVVLDHTPFYVESGGQISDTGKVIINHNSYDVTELKKVDGKILHKLATEKVKGKNGDTIDVRVDHTRRYDIMRNHTATHLVHSAMRQVLGDHVHQAGSLVSENNLRFDFAHYQKVSPEEVKAIEELVNEKVREAIPLHHHRNIPFDDAKKMGALMFFGDKYGALVNVVDFGPFSREFCGGTHVLNTSEIGLFKLTSESSIASGTRRIEAVTGRGIERWIHDSIKKVDELSREREQLEDEKRKLEKEIAKLKMSSRADEAKAIVEKAVIIEGTKIKLSTTTVSVSDAEEFKSFAEMVQKNLGNGVVVVLGANVGGNASLIAMVSDDLVKEKKLSAGKIVGAVAEIVGGKGGGRPNLAQAGGKHPEKIKEALDSVGKIVSTMLG